MPAWCEVMGDLEDLDTLSAIRPPKSLEEAAKRLWMIQSEMANTGPFRPGEAMSRWCVNLSAIWYFIDKTAKEET